ncbi:beta-galactosidase [Bifidobacterium imperatoris]|uniref:Beta-galactosidase n=1 Tax=Bifidobacterium imperatoris TaxID=2020965 RepID=A0A2N5IPR9_9BIFI|nr:beta-galactosidase [Bifidobacterium imperatoris]PLS23965.1 beta-galactosidase [Bifidobacterium imperatoris]QSY57857.1 beta-galactosidase [Bifidobacterium imperatoris]
MAARRPFQWPALLTRDGRGIAYGGDYNPDQWPESMVDEDIRLMREAHVNTVALAIFSWDKIEPQEGEFTFDWLDAVISKLGEAGIAVDLASATASAPMWLYVKHPEVLPQDKYGHTVNAGSRQSWQPTSPVFKEYALTLCRKLAEHYKNNPYVTAWHMGNEYGWNNRYDYSDNALNAFRSWCEAKYGSIEQLNEAWGTAFWSQHVNDFDEVLLPRHMGGDAMVNPAQQLDYERFGNDMLLDFYKAERDAIAEICPDKPFTTNFMVSTDQCTMDYAKWADEVDFVSNDHYFHEGESHVDELLCSDALMDSLALGKPWYVMEHSTSSVQWKPLNARKRHGELMRDALAHVAMGADAINFFQWRQSASGAEAFHSAMLPHAGEDSKIFRGVCELGEALHTLSEAGLQGTELQHADTAILFSAESEWATRSQTLPSMKLNHWHDVRDWYRGLLDAGHRADVVPLAYDWNNYQTIILPTVLILSDHDAQRIANFVQAGGTVVIGYATGIIDEHFRVGLGGYPGAGQGLLREMLGIRSEEFNILGDEAEGEPNAMTLTNGCTSKLWQNDVTSIAANTTVIASYAGAEAFDWELDAVPAVTSHPYGSGTAIYVGCDLDRQGIALLAESLGIEVDDSRVVHTIRRAVDGTRFDCYLNRDRQPVSMINIDGEPVIAYRCTNGSTRGEYVLHRNSILITKRVE